MATNPAPSTILNRRIIFATVNSTNGNVINEPFQVFGPYAQGIRITRLRTGDKAVIPLTSETGEGSFFIKLHYPNTSSSNASVNKTMYVTFCTKNSTYDDGYKDYLQRVPAAYVAAMKNWIDNGRTPSTSGVIRYRKLSFTGYGSDTAQANNAVSFEIRFNYRGANVGNNGNNTNNITNVDNNVTFGPNNTGNNTNGNTNNTNVLR